MGLHETTVLLAGDVGKEPWIDTEIDGGLKVRIQEIDHRMGGRYCQVATETDLSSWTPQKEERSTRKPNHLRVCLIGPYVVPL